MTVAVNAFTLGLAACDAVAYVAVDVAVAPIVAIVIKLNRKSLESKREFLIHSKLPSYEWMKC